MSKMKTLKFPGDTEPREIVDAKAREDISKLSEEIANLGGSVDVSVEPAEDDIPKVFFGGALQQTKDAAVVPFRYISKTQDISGYAEIKAQGNSSMSYPKKNQTVKLFKDADCTEKLKVNFKGWGMQNKHVYKANWIDLSHARNVVSARLWADVVKSRAGYENLPELLRTSPNQGAVDGFPVKVYAAGVYQGRYTLNIPKDKWMVNMDDALDTHCILCGENYVSGCFRAAASINGSDWTDEIHGTVPDAIKTRWNEVISFVMNSTDEEFKANLGNYFDVESLLDYHLFGLVSCGLDAYGKNQIYMTYDGQKWIASMYDMDSTWGLWWTGASFVATDYDRSEYQDFKDGEGNLLYIRLEELFYEELQARWAELKNGAMSIENIINRFERFTDIAPSDLVTEDYASTTGGGSFTNIPSKTTNNIQQIRSFALARQAWTDEYVAGLTPVISVPCTGITLSAETLTFTAEGTQTLIATVTPDGCTDEIAWASDNSSVATVIDGVVTAVANGSATITATCGEYSASCSVTVNGIGVIDYTRNPLNGVSWNDNKKYENGELVAQVGDYVTDKFTLQACVYEFQTGDGNSYAALYAWNKNGDYVGNTEISSGSIGRFVAKSGWQYAVKVANSSAFDASTVSLLPVDQSVDAATTVVIDATTLEWSNSGNNVAEAVITDIISGAGFALSKEDIASKVNTCSHMFMLENNHAGSAFNGNGNGVVLMYTIYNNNFYLRVPGFTADTVAENVGTITIN